jgi:hypothetical protein
MKFRMMLGIVSAMYLCGYSLAQDVRIPVNALTTGKIVLNNLQGAVIIDGYEGTELIITVDGITGMPNQAQGLSPVFYGGYDNTGIGLLIEEINRIIEISGATPQSKQILYKFQVPKNLEVKVDCNSIQGQDIKMNAINKEIEVESKENDINLDNIKGPIVVNNMSGNIKISFTDLNQEYPTSISTVSGDIDVTLPSRTPANLILKSMTGEIYTNFELIFDPFYGGFAPTPYGGKTVYATINNGGIEVIIESVNGNIYLRKGE